MSLFVRTRILDSRSGAICSLLSNKVIPTKIHIAPVFICYSLIDIKAHGVVWYSQNKTPFFWFMYAFAAQAVVFGVLALILLQWVKQLCSHLASEHPKYYDMNIDAPFHAGNKTVFDQQRRSVKNTYFGQMPDELSRYYQRCLRRIAFMSLVVFASALMTLIVAVIITI